MQIPPVISVAALISNKNKLLFIKHSYINGYGIPGGGVLPGETLEGALRREIKEETGLSVKDMEYFSSYVSYFKGLPTLTAVYKTNTKGKLVSSAEGKAVWKVPSEVMKNLAYKRTLLTLKEYLDR